MLLGAISSVATLVLFVFYFIGRFWAIKKRSTLMLEDFELENIPNTTELENNADYYYELDGSRYGEIISMHSKQPLLWVKVFSPVYDENGHSISAKKVNEVASFDGIIPEGKPIYLKTDILEGFPRYKVVFRRFDYFIGSFEIACNGRVGGMSPLNYTLKPSIKGFLYYLFQ